MSSFIMHGLDEFLNCKVDGMRDPNAFVRVHDT